MVPLRNVRRSALILWGVVLTALGAAEALAERLERIAPAIASPEGVPRTALVIGNGAYASAPLRNPVRDARAMARALAETGFSVTLLEDASQSGMRRAIRDFGDQLARGGIGLFYYSGHGMQVRARNYLIPVKADIQREDEVEDQAVDANLVVAKMESARNSLNIIVLDACRNNPFARAWRSSARGLAQMDAPSGTLIAFATAPGSVASDGDGDNGLYTTHLLANLRNPGITVEQMFKQVRIAVTRETADRQVPWESSSLKGDFYFIPRDAEREAEAAREAREAAVRRAVQDAERRAAEERAELERKMRIMMEQLLAKQRADLDREMKARRPAAGAAAAAAASSAQPLVGTAMQREPAAAKPPPAAQAIEATPPSQAPAAAAAGEERPAEPLQMASLSEDGSVWESIRTSSNYEDFENYLARFPAGAHATEARARWLALAYGYGGSSAEAGGDAGLPRVGDQWTYVVRRPGVAETGFTVEVRGLAPGLPAVFEHVRWRDGRAYDWVHASEPLLIGVADDFRSFAPYLAAFHRIEQGERWRSVAFQNLGACSRDPELECSVYATVEGRESISVPAGTFQAWKVLVEIEWRRGWTQSGTVELTSWYAPEIRRVVKHAARGKAPHFGEEAEVVLSAYRLN
jgi:uncharacterized caspase-like protein